MNFFSSIADLRVQGGFTIAIGQELGTWVVSVLYHDKNNGDSAARKVPPIVLKGTPQELDEGFFAAIEQPVKETAGLFVNMEQYLKQREEAKKASKMEQDGKHKEQKEQGERSKKYDAAMKRVNELEDAGKYQEAIAALPKAADHPDKKEEIAACLEELRRKNGQLSLY